MPLEVGKMFGTYRIEDKLGEGGMGVVYKATDTELQRTVALKTLLTGPDPESVSRFVREAKAASRLQHATIVTIYHVGVEQGTRYIVMEYVQGQTLKKLIDARPMNIRELCDIAIQVAEGLVVAHDMGVIHRDIKAENVVITTKGQAKILDFGLAKMNEAHADGATFLQTEAGVVMGTVSHMSPEQAMGQEVDALTDVFSFGVMMYEMATGRMPFMAGSAQATLARVLNHEPDPVATLNPGCPPELAQVVHECLQKDRALRPRAAEVLTMLKSVRDSLSARSLGATTALDGTVVRPTTKSGKTLVTPVVSRPIVSKAAHGSGGAAAVAARPAGAAPRSGPTPSASAEAGPQTTAEAGFGLRAAYWALRALRIVMAVATLSVPLAYLAYFVIGGGLIRAEIVQGTGVMAFMQALVTPLLEAASKVLTFRTVVNGWNLLLPVAALAAFALRRAVMVPFERAEQRAKMRVVQATRAEALGAAVTAAAPAASNRMAALREYAETKRKLFEQKRRLAFLTVDVVEAARLKAGEDKLVVEHAVGEYRKYVERILGAHAAWKFAWRGENVVAAFQTLDGAVRAGQQVLSELPWFNDGVHSLRHRVEVHCGVAAGEVVFPEDRALEDVTDEVVDLATQLQETAPAGALRLTYDAFTELGDRSGFSEATGQVVTGQEIREWRPAAAGATKPPKSASTTPDADGPAAGDTDSSTRLRV